MANGKWNHIMDARHISFTSWNPPDKDVIPEVKEIEIPEGSDMGVAIEGSDSWWPMEKSEAVLPEFDCFNQQRYYIEVFNRGQVPFDYKIESQQLWLKVSPDQGKVDKQRRVWVSIDFQQVPIGTHLAAITINGPNGKSVEVQAIVKNPESPKRDEVIGFVESNGCVSVEAEHYTRAVEKEPVKWLIVPNLSRTLSGVMPVPVTARSQKPEGGGPRLEYNMYLFSSGNAKVEAYFCPTQDYIGEHGIRYAVSFDDEAPKVVNIHEKDTVPDWKYPPTWNQAVTENIKKTVSEHVIDKPGEHVLKFWMVDPGIVLQKIVVHVGGVKPSYLGPPESFYQAPKTNKFK